MYRHVQHLLRNGVQASIVHNDPSFKPAWFGADVPTQYLKNQPTISSGDVLVVPEVHVSWLKTIKQIPARKIVLCQNHFLIYEGLKDARSWQELGVSHAVATSEIIANFINTVMAFPDASLVHLGIDHNLFRPAPIKKRQIACMPRKMPGAFQFIRKTYERLAGADALPFAIIENMSEQDAARVLSESSIFLSLSWLEGFGLPPVEAMASGCTVVGFHGNGGREYATEQNGFWCEGDDWEAVARALHRVTGLVMSGDSQIARMTEAGIRTAARYSFANEEKDLLDFARKISGRP